MDAAVTRNNAEALHALFNPRAVAILGVSEDVSKHSRVTFQNAIASGYAGPIYPINRRLDDIDGVKCYREPAALPEPVDLVFMAIPAEATVKAVEDCAAAGVKVVIVGSAGFAESGEEGVRRQEALAELSARTGIRIVGPNCNGIYNATNHLSVGFNTGHTRRIPAGDIAILSHSGALFDILAVQLMGHGAGMSFFVSCGNEVDFDILDYLDHALDDPATRICAMLIDSLGDGARFRAQAARAQAMGKLIVVLKIGQTAQGAEAAEAHSSRLASSADAYVALLESCGVPLVCSLEGLSTAAAMLSFYGRVPGKLAAFSGSGAGASLLADLMARLGVPLAEFQPDTLAAVSKFRTFSKICNPADFGTFGGMANAREVPAIMGADPGVGMLMAQVQAQKPWQYKPRLASLAYARATTGKPFVVLAPGGMADDQRAAFDAADLRVFHDTFGTLQGIAALLTPAAVAVETQVAALSDEDAALLSLPRALTEPESLALLGRAGIATIPTTTCKGFDAMLAAAERQGWPVVLKGVVEGLAHKTEAGLVKIDLADADALRRAWLEMGSPEIAVVQPFMKGRLEAIAGITCSRDVGPILLAGLGGIYAEAIRDVVMWSLPVPRARIVDKLAGGALGRILRSPRWTDRGTFDSLVDILAKLQDFALAAGERLQAVDINPLILGDRGVVAVDALVIPRQG